MTDHPWGRPCHGRDEIGADRAGRVVCWHRGDPGQGAWVLWDDAGLPRWYPLTSFRSIGPATPPAPLPAALIRALKKRPAS